MKKVILMWVRLSSLVFFCFSCGGNPVSPSPSVLGKWTVLSDNQYTGVGLNNHQVTFTGQSGDYFDFRTNGKVYIKEGSSFDTLSYKLLSDTTVSITSFGSFYIRHLTVHNATLFSPLVITPGGAFGRTVGLNR